MYTETEIVLSRMFPFSAPGESSQLEVTRVTSRNMTIEWEPNPTRCPITYLVRYEGTAKWGELQEDPGMSTYISDTEIILQDIIPYSDYSIYMTANTSTVFVNEKVHTNQSTLEDGKQLELNKRKDIRTGTPRSM